MSLDSRTLRADLLLLLTALIWGAAFVAQRVGMEHIGPMAFNGVRFALGGLALTPLILRSGRPSEAPGAMVRKATVWTYVWAGGLAGLALFAGATLQQVGIVTTTAGKAGFITGLYVVIVPLLGLFLGQRPGWGTWVGAVLASVGLYFLSVTEEFTIAHGDFLELLGAGCWAGHVLLIGRLSPRMDPVRLAQAQFLVCSVLSLATAACTEIVSGQAILDAAVPILYGGLLSVGVAYTLQVVAQRDAHPAHASIILSMEGLFAALAGWVILDETLGLRALIGCGLMLLGMLVSQLKP